MVIPLCCVGGDFLLDFIVFSEAQFSQFARFEQFSHFDQFAQFAVSVCVCLCDTSCVSVRVCVFAGPIANMQTSSD